ncbi:hypothetical protein CLOSYM_03883 [[Clostridium] symbiosum ATCC 14940]|uniref:Uncharacterized protein n=1 Tax=[Clostridium] symbiosum ATCC 14940 TaxID=411472 RepID=A0ABC9TTM8_CLOSY|nr:hypothetical protein CLOSYM_03883 [[Clostridium] symbiosum ATCC 14940]
MGQAVFLCNCLPCNSIDWIAFRYPGYEIFYLICRIFTNNI